jgi:4-hydroxy-tetrahydrodipicolinate synthase
LPTPFGKDGDIDVEAFEELCRRQIRHGANALVVCGTTGEAPTLTPVEHTTLIQSAVRAARGQVPVIAGAGSNSTSHAIELTKDAEDAGADGILSIVPYYNKPSQAGLYQHFHAIARSPACQSSCMTYLHGRGALSPMKRLRVWRSCRKLSASRTPPAM